MKLYELMPNVEISEYEILEMIDKETICDYIIGFGIDKDLLINIIDSCDDDVIHEIKDYLESK